MAQQPPWAFFDFVERAEEYLAASRRLEPQPPCDWARYLLIGHAVEVALKAYLLQRGVTMEVLRSQEFGRGHGLVRLLTEAKAKGLTTVSADIEKDIGHLAHVHGAPYLARYPEYEGKMKDGIVVVEELEGSVHELMKQIRVSMGLGR